MSGPGSSPEFGIVADDTTGATDAAGMLPAAGVRTILFMDVGALLEDAALTRAYDAVAVVTGSRSIRPDEARKRIAVSVKALHGLGVQQIQFKYSSSFDSTPEGNIGPSLDSALDSLGAPGTIVCPALPVNGRTTRHGLHYVDGRLLSESGMKDHPLNPMTDPDLVRWLQRQTARRVGLVELEQVREGADALRGCLESRVDGGEQYLVTDAVEQSDIQSISRATRDWPLISGSSALTMEVPGLLFPGRGLLDFADRLEGGAGGMLVAAGSCTPATRTQNSFAVRHGFGELRLDGIDALSGRVEPGRLADAAASELSAGGDVVLCSSAAPEEVERVQAHGAAGGLSAVEAGERIAGMLAEVTGRLVEKGVVSRLVVSGGETSNAVCERLGIRAFEVGLQIDPGVPVCFPVGGRVSVMALKSGNFGSQDFYPKAREVMARRAGHG